MDLENGKITNLMKFKLQPISGDASFRKFYRLKSKTGSKIIVYAEKDKYSNLLAYAAVNNFLRENKILAPKLYNHNYKKGIIIIEDFGDQSLHKVLLKKKNKLNTYKKIVNLLVEIQKIKPKPKIKDFNNQLYSIKKYSKNYLHKETDLFLNWYLPIFLKKNKAKKVKKRINFFLSTLYDKINLPNSCFVHRDYHVKNLINVDKKIGVIDSQDALIGNPAYDLVSLIDDVRIKTSKKIKNKIYNYYLKKTNQIYKNNSEKFLNDFNILSVQRSLKIIGIFSRLFKRDKKKRYLKLIPYTWKLLEMRMNSDIFYDLRTILSDNFKKKDRKKILFK